MKPHFTHNVIVAPADLLTGAQIRCDGQAYTLPNGNVTNHKSVIGGTDHANEVNV